jgi:hypothetical protein
MYVTNFPPKNFGNGNHVKFIHHKFEVIANECYAFKF